MRAQTGSPHTKGGKEAGVGQYGFPGDMKPRVALRKREKPGLGTEVRYGLFEGLWGTPQGEAVEERGAGPELGVSRWESAGWS